MLEKEGLSGDKQTQEIFSKLKASVDKRSGTGNSNVKSQELRKRNDIGQVISKLDNSKESTKTINSPTLEDKKSPTNLMQSLQLEKKSLNQVKPVETRNIDRDKKNSFLDMSPGSNNTNTKEKDKKLDQFGMISPIAKDDPFKRKPLESKVEDLKVPIQSEQKSEENKKKQVIHDLHVPDPQPEEKQKELSPKKPVKEELTLGEEFKPKKVNPPAEEQPEFPLKTKEEKVKDPFSHLDNVDPAEVAKQNFNQKTEQDQLGSGKNKKKKKPDDIGYLDHFEFDKKENDYVSQNEEKPFASIGDEKEKKKSKKKILDSNNLEVNLDPQNSSRSPQNKMDPQGNPTENIKDEQSPGKAHAHRVKRISQN